MMPSPSRALIISGGVSHDFADSSQALATILANAGFDCEVSENPNAAWDLMAAGEIDLVTINTLRWRMHGAAYSNQAETWAYHVDERAKSAMAEHLKAGRGLLAMHAASLCFDDWPEWGIRYLGASWVWGYSRHDPPGPAHVRIAGTHELLGDAKAFDIVDEIYTNLAVQADVKPLAYATVDGHQEEHPVLWTRQVGSGRVVYDALGHDRRSLEQPDHKAIIIRAARWAARLTQKIRED